MPIAWLPPGGKAVRLAADTIAAWLLPGAGFATARRSLAVLFVGGALALLFVRRRESLPTVAWAKWSALFAGGYVAFVLATIAFVYANTPLDMRLLGPVRCIGTAAVVALFATQTGRLRTVPLAGGCWAAVVVVLSLAQSVPVALAMNRTGFGYASNAWKNSAAIAAVKLVRPDVPIYTNAPDAIRLLAGRDALSLPSVTEDQARAPNPAFETEMEEMEAAMRSGAIAVVFRRGVSRYYMIGEQELRSRLADADEAVVGDALFLRIGAPPRE